MHPFHPFPCLLCCLCDGVSPSPSHFCLIPIPRYLIIENFIPPEEKNKIMNRLFLDCEEEQWKFQPLVPAGV